MAFVACQGPGKLDLPRFLCTTLCTNLCYCKKGRMWTDWFGSWLADVGERPVMFARSHRPRSTMADKCRLGCSWDRPGGIGTASWIECWVTGDRRDGRSCEHRRRRFVAGGSQTERCF
jgi:hypothetical protein